jgi:protease I
MNNDKQLDGVRVAILACSGVEQAELQEPRKALEAAGAKTTLISVSAGQVQAFHHHDKGDQFPVQATFDNAKPSDFDAVLLPGGALNADQIRTSEGAQKFVQAMDRDGKPFAIICHAPWLLVSAGLVRGRHLTSWPSIQDDLRNAGARWTDEQVVQDRNWVSSRKPADIPAFNRAVIDVFAHHHHGTAA